jgi:hypothetical protein
MRGDEWIIRKPMHEVIEIDSNGNPLNRALVPERMVGKGFIRSDSSKGIELLKRLNKA